MADIKAERPGTTSAAGKGAVLYHDETDGTYSMAEAAHLRYWNTGTLQWERASGTAGALAVTSSGGGGAVTIADGADVAEGATSDVAWVSGNGSLIAINKAEFAKLEAIRALLAGTLTVNTGLTDTQLRASAVAVSLAAETTKVIGVTRSADGSGNLLTSTGSALDINIKSGNPASITANAGINLNTSALALDATLTNATQKTKIVDTAGTNVAAVNANGGQAVAGDVASAAADSGNPQKIGGKISSAAPGAGTVGNRVDAWFGVNGQLIFGLGPATYGDGASLAGTIPDSSGTNRALAVAPVLFNGTNVDRERGNWNTTTGDTGAKTITFAGATQTNYNARGAMITIVCGTVTGTTPTMACQLQFSPDGGTTWINYGAAAANLTATGNTCVINCYPDNGSPTTGATATVNTNGPLPRTWRINYTIGGTSPSFTITAVYVNYVV